MSRYSLILYRKIIKHRYDYDNALGSTGKAFYDGDAITGNYMEYHYHYMGRPGRRKIVDRVVKYKYPKGVGTNYQKEHAKYNTTHAVGRNNSGEPFNVEKEHKIINPHRVDKHTTYNKDYRPYKVYPNEKKKMKAPSPQKGPPIKSSYQSDFQNWGPNEIIHEKDPQYPYYSLPFKGSTNYARTFCGGSDDENAGRGMPFGMDSVKGLIGSGKGDPRNHAYSTGYNHGPYSGMEGHGGQGGHGGYGGYGNSSNGTMGKSVTNLKPFLATTNAGATFETTNQRAFKNYQIKHRPQTCKPKVEAVRTTGNPQHFTTNHKKEYVNMKYKPPAVDMIPYP